WFNKLGIKKKNMRFRQHLENELSHYALDTWDLEYKYSFGFKELMGCANRTQFDLQQHEKHSNVKMQFQEQTKEGLKRYTPFVVAEPSMGVGRILLAILAEGYTEEEVQGRKRVVFKLSPKLSPYDIAIFPLQKDEKIYSKAKEIFNELRKQNFVVYYDDSGSIGKRYRRMDEIGTPFCVTIDFESLEDNSVTIRDRDSMEQIRVPVTQISEEIRNKQINYTVD
ncbi:MAG: His/Gly/Thr/Pro-type tRNA ligase C-terminal domain-containing protein, partial [Candidatus Hodarchaeales archaeon]